VDYTLESAVHAPGRAWGDPPVTGRLRLLPEDFQVRELPLLEPGGEGEHVWLLIRKRQVNTEAVVRQLARCAGIASAKVSYAGLKDRQAVAEQWFSVHLPGREEPDWNALNSQTLTVLRHARHPRKLRRGALRGNAFTIRVRNLGGDCALFEQRLAQVAAGGVPNYFGIQRFGRGGSNLQTAGRLFARRAGRLSRAARGLAFSAARSWLFNQVLARRVAEHSWDHALPGEALQLQGSHSFFIADSVDPSLEQRLQAMDVHPTGPLFGQGETPVRGACRRLEEECLLPHEAWCRGLITAGLAQARRATRLPVGALRWEWPEADCIELHFHLPPGGYATSVLRELLHDTDH
jgi:tRNA pseudouridine13 synthase